MKVLDKVTEAYFGGMGELFARKTRERIHWICSKVQGQRVLNVGCSQGITEVLLAREGKYPVGIDIEEEAIEYAKNALLNESESVKRNVEYHACSIFDFNVDYKFETVIMAEVMEHFSSSASLLTRVSDMLTDDGTIVVTVPFGINDFIDHKKTYYLVNLLEEITPFFGISEIKFLGQWIGLVASKKLPSQQLESLLKIDLIKQLEANFHCVERYLVDDLREKTTYIKKINTQLSENRQTINQLKSENEQLKKSNDKLVDDYEQLKRAFEKMKQEQETYQTKISETDAEKYKREIAELKKTIEEKNKEILNRLDSEENTLKKYKDAIYKYNNLEARFANISKKYDLLSKSKLGRLTLKYWKMRKRIPDNF
ncbi:SAM-dependent methyltransferase [Paenibacillus sp. 32O-W]|uniref:methyltransferase domain-containing protein n=1 Tax=Paenibacillus sp. 32O-W TaxID=1695218 RepID=UPI00071FAC88|nr:methyltransferase domain-containing protein [Paenibacillus sp. 32O-W]ALS25942.1 SAM-dependent methyltransferase [Paenibacillus sp. 32O-W]